MHIGACSSGSNWESQQIQLLHLSNGNDKGGITEMLRITWDN